MPVSPVVDLNGAIEQREFRRLIGRIEDKETCDVVEMVCILGVQAGTNAERVGHAHDGLGNCIRGLRAATTVLLERLAPEEFLVALDRIYGDEEEGGDDA